MDSSPIAGPQQDIHGKGKARAHFPTERTPLLAAQSSSSIPVSNAYDDDISRTSSASRETSRRQLRSKLTTVFLVSLSLTITVFILVALLAWSYAAEVSKKSPDDVVKEAVVVQGPDRVNVHNISSNGEIWLTVDARIGVDAGVVVGVGVNHNPNNNEDTDTSLLSGLWKAFGRWGIQQVDRVTVTLSTITIISSRSDPTTNVLASIRSSPVVVSLAANPPSDDSWLTPVSLSVVIQPNTNASAWTKFIRESWSLGTVDVQAYVGEADVKGGFEDERSWRSLVHRKMVDVKTRMSFRIPSIPGLPPAGGNSPFPSVQELITLESFHISSNASHLDIHASATAINPTPPNFEMVSPSLPFIVSLPHSESDTSSLPPIPIASVSTAPFKLTHPNITFQISGTVLPLANDSTQLLSSFLSRYLSSQPNTILISSPLLLPSLSLQAIFPAPIPPPRILRNVTIKDMKVKPGTTAFLASGMIEARIVLPKGVDVDLNVSRVLPDVMVFDGEVPDTIIGPIPVPPPLPDPLPQGAFGHIRPEDWVNAISFRNREEEEDGEGEGATFVVMAKIVDVPIEVLPGRQKEFSNFIGKVVFGSEGAIAGILGSTAVAARVRGMPLSGHDDGVMELGGLPFRGSVRLGKKSI